MTRTALNITGDAACAAVVDRFARADDAAAAKASSSSASKAEPASVR